MPYRTRSLIRFQGGLDDQSSDTNNNKQKSKTHNSTQPPKQVYYGLQHCLKKRDVLWQHNKQFHH